MPQRIDDMFAALAETDNVTYVVSSEFRITHVNDAWHRFARMNGGERISTSVSLLDVIPPPLLPFYHAGFARTCDTGERWEHDYECSSPELFRKFRMVVYPFGRELLVTHSLLVETPHPSEMFAAGHAYVRDGLITMCSHCRRVRVVRPRERWDWVPAYLRADQTRTSHGLCAGCYAYYYELS